MILVTGSEGYIGTAVKRELHRLRTRYEECDVKTGVAFQHLSDEALVECDTIIHLAGISSVRAADEEPLTAWSLNSKDTAEFAERAKWLGVRRFVFASSAAVYGDTGALSVPVTEDCPLNPLTEYARTKSCAESRLRELADDIFAITALRIGSVNGVCESAPRGFRADNVVNAMVRDALTEGKISLNSNQSVFRNVAHVSDVARAIARIAILPLEWQWSALNIGGLNLSLSAIAEEVNNTVGRRADIVLEKCDDPTSYKIDSHLAMRRYRWEPAIGLQEIIRSVHALLRPS